jgi:peptide/nickel transport system substrate-binding protein
VRYASGEAKRVVQRWLAAATILSLAGVAGCTGAPDTAPGQTILRVGFGLSSGQNPTAGMRQAVLNVALEGLINFSRQGQPQPWLVESWSQSGDGLALRLKLKPGVRFHDGQLLTAATVRDALVRQLPDSMGALFQDIAGMVTIYLTDQA